MTAVAHVYPNAVQNLANHAEKWTASGQDSFYVALVGSGTYTWGTTPYGHSTMTNFLAGDGTDGALTEVSTSSTGYARQLLTSVTFTTSGLVSTLTAATMQWTATSSWSAKYAVFYDGVSSSASDSTNELVCYWDFGGTVSVVSGGNFTLTVNASGIVTFTAS